MSSKKISQLPLGVPTGSDIFPFVQGGITKKGLISTIPSSFVELTYAAASTLISTSGLTKGSFYKITDRGDNGIILQANEVNEFSPSGIRLMLCPIYEIVGNMLGFWNGISGTTSFNSGDRVIWGGYYWENVSGGTGTALDVVTLDSEWTLVPKSIANGYQQREFDIQYDFSNDWIEKQMDNYGNQIGVPYIDGITFFVFNPCDHSDWNVYSSPGVSSFYNNIVASGIYNNTDDVGNPIDAILGNIISFPDLSGGQYLGISNNILIGNGGIISNYSELITNNTINGSIVGNYCSVIVENTNLGDIVRNIITDFGQGIGLNSNNGDIEGNYTSQIQNNSNDGSINENIVNVSIVNNSNLGNISRNNLQTIQGVSVSGDCNFNTGGGELNFIQSFSGNCNGNVISNNFGRTYYQFDFTTNPLISGTPQYFQSIPQDSKVTGYYAQGNSLSSSTNSATIEVGPNIDDPSVINVSIVTLNSGSSDTTLMSSSILTTADRLFEINAITEDVTGGTLSIWIDYVIQ